MRIWQWKEGIKKVQAPITLCGHKSAISALNYNQSESNKYTKAQLLSSGSRDGKIVVWDTLQQKGLFRLQGHKDQITQIAFLVKSNCIISSSKDTLVKLWDLETQHCFQTVVGHRREVWAFAIDKNESRLYSGAADSHIRVFQFKYPEDNSNLPTLDQIGMIPKESKDRVTFLSFPPSTFPIPLLFSFHLPLSSLLSSPFPFLASFFHWPVLPSFLHDPPPFLPFRHLGGTDLASSPCPNFSFQKLFFLHHTLAVSYCRRI